MPSTVVALRTDQCHAAGDVVARSFADNAIFCAIFPNAARRHRILRSAAPGMLIHGLLSGQVAEATPRLTAVSLWTPPGYRDSVTSWVRALPHLLGCIARLTPADARRYLRCISVSTKRRQEMLPEPHWYLEMLCSEPRWQGYGLGAVLALHGLERAAREGKPVFLETDTPENVRFYSKMGFKIVEAGDEDLYHIPIWRMVCRPEDAIVPKRGPAP